MASVIRALAPLFSLALLSACATSGESSDGAKTGKDTGKDAGKDTGKDTSDTPEVTTKVAISAVQMIQDCPDEPDPEPPAGSVTADSIAPASPEPPAKGTSPGVVANRRIAGGGDFVQPCDQSTMQLTLESSAGGAVEVKAIRLLSDGKQVGELTSRKPTAWTDDAYSAWAQTLEAGEPTRASYKLSLPDWGAVEKAIEGESFGRMFTLEVDIEIDGELETMTSPEFPREQPHVIVT